MIVHLPKSCLQVLLGRYAYKYVTFEYSYQKLFSYIIDENYQIPIWTLAPVV